MPHDDFRFAVHDTVPPELAAIVDAGLDRSNSLFAPLGDVEPLACSSQLPDGCTIGGAIGRTWGTCCELQQIWVDPEFRRTGVARRLLGDFEAKAKLRGCRTLYLETFSFQCPNLYLDHGYEIALTIKGFPNGVEKHIMTLTLRPA